MARIVMQCLALWSTLITINATNPLQSWMNRRCGTWLWEGHLLDPLTGQKLAQVQGLELLRVLEDTEEEKTENNKSNNLKLSASDLLQEDPSVSAGTLLSRKLFVYQSPDDTDKILSSVKLRATSPRRKVPLAQAISAYDTAVTVAAPTSGPWLFHTELANGKTMWNHATVDYEQNDDAESWSFGSFFKLGNKKKITIQAPDTKTNLQPARSAIVSFGPSQAETQGKFGARETYRYISRKIENRRSWRQTSEDTKDDCTLQYSRYGEGPVWYGPSRLCQLELTGKRIEDGRATSSLLDRVIRKHVPNFFELEQLNDRDAVQAFQQQSLAVIDTEEDGYSRTCKRVQGVWDCVRGSISAGPLGQPQLR